MASTYSNLKIELIATGEQSGTWGITTNTNLGTALEEAIVGSADVTFASADVTLTLTDTNASQTARNFRLNLTGTSGGARNLIVPAIEKSYIIYNGVADTVTVKNSTGTGIAVPTGKTMMVYNDGTNVVDVTTYASSMTLGAALPVASGGTGISSGTSGGVPYFSSTSVISSSGALSANAIVVGGGAGSAPTTTTAPRITGLNDTNGNELIIATATASAVNEVTLANAATGSNPRFSATGSDTNIGLSFAAKGTGAYEFVGTSDTGAQLRLFEDSDNGSNYVSFKAPSIIASNITWTLPGADGTSGQVLSTDGAGTLSWTTASGGGVTTGKSIAMAMIFGF